MTPTDRSILALTHLLDVCTDGVDAYRQASEAIQQPDTRSVLTRNSAEREEVVAVLTNKLVELGHAPAHNGTLEGTLQCGWLRALGAAHAEDTVLRECMRGERATIDAFAEALASELPRDVRSLVQTQLGRVLVALERIDTATSRRSLTPRR